MVTAYVWNKTLRTFEVFIESELLEVKVPIISLVTRGFSLRRDGRYQDSDGGHMLCNDEMNINYDLILQE